MGAVDKFIYELRETRSNNLIGSYGSLKEAVAFLCSRAAKYGRKSVDALALDETDEDGNGHTILFGYDELQKFLHQRSPERRVAAG